tara:strand:- start:6670 stop:7314 length:645 start_codon:yes stop_codon:yes gene_type:complete
MDEDISIVNVETRKQKIIKFFLDNKKKIISILLILVFLIFAIFVKNELNKRKKISLSEDFNKITLNYKSMNKESLINELSKIIHERDNTYSPLALYFLIDNQILLEKEKVNKFFDILIEKTNLDNEILNLIIYKKALFNSDFVDEITLLSILDPLIKKDTIWKPQAYFLLAEFSFDKNEKQKAKKYYEKILTLNNVNSFLTTETRIRLNRDLSE